MLIMVLIMSQTWPIFFSIMMILKFTSSYTSCFMPTIELFLQNQLRNFRQLEMQCSCIAKPGI